MSKISVASYVPSANDMLILDTNILIHLFYPIMSTTFMAPYEKLYSDILSKHASLLLPAIQLSEFINRCIRFQFGLYKNYNNNYNLDFKKDYRCTEDYRESMNSILDIVKSDILKNFKQVDDHFSSLDPNKYLLFGFSYDFNDALLVQIANFYNASIITHDIDFANYTTTKSVITNNNLLLHFH